MLPHVPDKADFLCPRSDNRVLCASMPKPWGLGVLSLPIHVFYKGSNLSRGKAVHDGNRVAVTGRSGAPTFATRCRCQQVRLNRTLYCPTLLWLLCAQPYPFGQNVIIQAASRSRISSGVDLCKPPTIQPLPTPNSRSCGSPDERDDTQRGRGLPRKRRNPPIRRLDEPSPEHTRRAPGCLRPTSHHRHRHRSMFRLDRAKGFLYHPRGMIGSPGCTSSQILMEKVVSIASFTSWTSHLSVRNFNGSTVHWSVS